MSFTTTKLYFRTTCYFGDITPTLVLEHGLNLLNQHQGLNRLIQLLQLHPGGDSPGIILLHSDQLLSHHVAHTFILNGGLNCANGFMSFLYVSVLFLSDSFLYYVHHQFLLPLALIINLLHLLYGPLAQCTYLW